SNSSYRINIRGSSLRSPFDVRNVKVYWNGIPYTEAGGSTSFNLLDPSFFGNMEIIRGPSSSLYGAGNGGVILIDSKKEKGKFVEYGFTAGSFGFQKHNFAAGLPAGSGSHTIHFSNVKVDGYRNHSEMDRSTFEYNGLFSINSDQSIEANILYTDLFYEIPGGLNATQYEADPQQARPRSEESNASAKVKNLLMGLNYKNELSSNLTLNNSFYSVVHDFENPFILDYKREAQQGIGTRNTLQYQHDKGLAKLKHTLGVEIQYSFTSARNYGNVAGVSDTLNFDDQIRNRQSVLFLQSEFQRENLHLTAGLSVNHLKYDIYRLWDVDLDSTYQFVRNFAPVITPRISALYNFGKVSVYGVTGYGFSPPTLDEVRTNEGSLNTDIDAEKGVNYEIGTKAEILPDLYVEFSAFYYQLKNTIVDYSSLRGTDLYRNSGSTDQKGVEISARYDLPNRKEFRLENSVYLSYTYHDFKFREYIINSNDYSGNYLPGIAPHTVSMTWNTTDKSGLYFSAFYLYKDAIPLNNVNDVEANDFHLLNLKMGYKKDVRMRYHEGANNLVKTSDQLNVYVGINNTLDKKYSLGNDVNAFGGRYYQPAASRNFVVGVSYKLGY
ncbi:MAG: TonB-dependent receptor plug domain-containing protein, partial [Cyclobacteriaceae bacterium]|nr:TonB-dependent receptor plug domain-containing protein [Cyclobacteriaceae bacterium]